MRFGTRSLYDKHTRQSAAKHQTQWPLFTPHIRSLIALRLTVPSLTALKTLPAACEASMASRIWARGKTTGLSFIGGAIRSIQSLRAMLSPSSAFDIAVWVNASACPSRRLSIAMVALLREPLGRPPFPSVNLPSVFRPFIIWYIITHMD